MPSETESCATCVHGDDLDMSEDSAVVCAPQHKVHARHYRCTAYRRITLKELDERNDAAFGEEDYGQTKT